MNAWETVSGQRTMESIRSITEDVDKIGRNYPTLRDQFAMQFMNAWCSNLSCSLEEVNENYTEKVAETSYLIADAMLKAREEK